MTALLNKAGRNLLGVIFALSCIHVYTMYLHHDGSDNLARQASQNSLHVEDWKTLFKRMLFKRTASTIASSVQTTDDSTGIISKLHRPSPDCQHIVKHHRCSKQYSFDVDVKLEDNANVLILGDSLPWQMWMTLKCMLPPKSPISFDFEGMHLFPESESRFIDTLKHYTKNKHYDYLVFTIGTWYNWKWGDDIDTSVPMNWTMDTLNTWCPSGLRKELFAQKDVYQRGLLSRSKCKKLLSMNAYVSGLKKLKKIAELGTFPPIIWKDVPPQHFGNTSTGQFDWGGVGGMCSDISDTKHAYSRNRIADFILKGSVLFARTWETDITSWKNHVANDCTHYCNPSDNTINWGVEVLKTIAAQFSKPGMSQKLPLKKNAL